MKTCRISVPEKYWKWCRIRCTYSSDISERGRDENSVAQNGKSIRGSDAMTRLDHCLIRIWLGRRKIRLKIEMAFSLPLISRYSSISRIGETVAKLTVIIKSGVFDLIAYLDVRTVRAARRWRWLDRLGFSSSIRAIRSIVRQN